MTAYDLERPTLESAELSEGFSPMQDSVKGLHSAGSDKESLLHLSIDHIAEEDDSDATGDAARQCHKNTISTTCPDALHTTASDVCHSLRKHELNLDSVLISPVLQLAMVESPKERVLVRSRSSSIRKNSLGVLDPNSSLEVGSTTPIVNHCSSNTLTPGGSNKSVKFGIASLLNTSDEHNDYFSTGM